MKKIIISAVLMIFCSLPVFAQGLYFDIGLGFGKGKTKIDGVDYYKFVKNLGFSPSQLGMEFGLKAGYGPIGDMPLYIVGEYNSISHLIYEGSNFAQFNSYILGPGVIYYPTSLIQLGTSIGFSWISNSSDYGTSSEKSKSGYAYNLYGAIDLGGTNHGCLIGLKYSYAKNNVELTGYPQWTQKQSLISVFVKYAYRSRAEE